MPGVIKINPSVYSDKRDAAAVAWNEALRLFMEDEAFTPKFDVTPEQLEFFKGTAYADDPGALAKTVVARIATRDTSVPDPTPGQIAETRRLLEAVLARHKGTPDGRVVEKLLAGLGQTGGKAPAAPAGGTAADAIGGGDVIVTARAGEEAERVAAARGIIEREKALVRKATPWYMSPGAVDDRIVLRRPQGTTPSGEPVYTYRRLDGSPAVRAPAVRPAGALEGRARETMALARDIAGLATGATRSAASDIKDLGNAGKNIQTASGAAQGRNMSRAAGFDVDMRYGTEAEAAAEYKDVDLGFGKGKVAPETLAPGDPGYAEEREAQRRMLRSQ